MAVIGWPQDVGEKQQVTCVVCRETISPSCAAVGLADKNGHQAFACNRHFMSGSFIVGWADFVAQEYAPLQQLTDNNSDEWPSIY